MPELVSYVLSLRDQLTPGIEKANIATNKLEGSIGSLQSSLGGLAGAFGVAFGTAGIVAMGSAIVSAGSKVEDARVGLTTLLKDGDEAARVIQNTMQDALKTPFAFEGLLNANKALISADETADGARETILNLANAISATGGGDDELNRMVVNLQQIKNVGQASALDIKQFAYAGINLYKVLADAGIKVEKGAKDQKITYEEIAGALKKAHEAGGIYYNGLENMANNTSVQISNLGDLTFQLAVRMFDDLKPAITGVIETASSFIATLGQMWDWSVRNRDAIQEVGTYLVVAGGAFLTYKAIMLGVIASSKLMLFWEAVQLASINILGDAYLVASTKEIILAAAQWALNVAMTANPIGLIIAGLAALVAGVMYAYNHFEKFRATLWAVWATIKEFASIVTDAFGALWKVIHGTFTLNAGEIHDGMMQGIDVIANAGNRLGKAFKGGWDDGVADFAKDQNTGTAKKGLVPTGKKTTGTKPVGTRAPAENKTKATGSKSVTINVTIKDLIGEYNSNVTNIKEASAEVRAQVVQALTSAVNDFQIVAGS